jgi:stalled ribosome alternative rescue factor ArfA
MGLLVLPPFLHFALPDESEATCGYKDILLVSQVKKNLFRKSIRQMRKKKKGSTLREIKVTLWAAEPDDTTLLGVRSVYGGGVDASPVASVCSGTSGIS